MRENTKLVPKRRFKEFQNAGDWKQRKLGECLKLITYGFTNPMPDTDNGPWKITAKDIVDGQINYNTARHTETQAYENLLTSKSKPVLEDVLLTKDGTLGRSAIVRENGVCINQSVALLRCNQDVLCPSFLNVLLSSKRYQSKMLDDAGGGTIKHIYISKVEKMAIEIPDLDEQKQISAYFQKLDNLITLYQRKLEKMKSLKSAYLSEMFPKEGEREPKRRFTGFTGAWEQRKLSDIADIIGGGTPSTSVSEYWDGDIDWYSPTEIGKNVYADSSEKKITELGYEKSSARMLPANRTVLFTSRAGIGDMAILRRSATTNQGFQSLVLKAGIDTYFIYSSGHLIKEYAMKNASGSTFLEISGKQLGNMKMMVPSQHEQEQIGTFFRNIDNLITLHQCKLEKLQNIKKAYLNEMFI